MAHYINDGSSDAPKLQVFLNLDTLLGLSPQSLWPGLEGGAMLERLKADGFQGVQVPGINRIEGLPHCGLGRVNTPAEALPLARQHADLGDLCLTLHVGWGIEDDDEVFRLVEAILAASESTRLPIFIETHRATITQDMWRTVQIVKRFPEVLFNGDFSHYYCGQEMVYGGEDYMSGVPIKMEFMAPVFDRIGFLHGRIASPGSMQMPIDDTSSRPAAATGMADYFEDFRTMWTRAMRGFVAKAGPGDILVFAPEILAPTYYYARVFRNQAGGFVEESDRYAQALLYRQVALECFEVAQN
ncbi:MAG: hypothetical protein RL630_2009 [Verrucomicrobiota bacterium]|jgi:hypothetical protein